MFNVEAELKLLLDIFLFLLEEVEENVYFCSVERKRKFQMFQSFIQNDFLQTTWLFARKLFLHFSRGIFVRNYFSWLKNNVS